MELVPIFTDEDTLAGLYAIRYTDGTPDEYERLFDFWNDVQYITNYFKSNIGYLRTPFFQGRSIDSLVTQILNESYELQQQIDEYTEAGFAAKGDKLEMLFRPLGQQATIPIHQQTKAKLKQDKLFQKPLLRLYALRLGPNSFVITGGAIKLVHEMKDHKDTERELEKLDEARAFLKKQNIKTDDDLMYYYEQS